MPVGVLVRPYRAPDFVATASTTTGFSLEVISPAREVVLTAMGREALGRTRPCGGPLPVEVNMENFNVTEMSADEAEAVVGGVLVPNFLDALQRGAATSGFQG